MLTYVRVDAAVTEEQYLHAATRGQRTPASPEARVSTHVDSFTCNLFPPRLLVNEN